MKAVEPRLVATPVTNETITSESEDETAGIARRLAATLSAGDTILLFGDLGAGKTAFVRGLAAGLGIDAADVTSPTFTLVQEYRGGRLTFVHADLYRLDDPREIEDLGLEEIAAGGILAVEWAEKLTRRPERAIEVRISHRTANERTIAIAKC